MMMTSKRRNNKRQRGRGRRSRGAITGWKPTSTASGVRLNTFGGDNKISYVTRSAYADVTLNGSTTLFYGLSFNVQGYYLGATFVSWTSGAADVPALFDFYRIVRVEVTVLFNNNFSQLNTTTYTLPYVFDAVDYNDANLTAVGDIAQRATAEMHIANSNGIVFTRSFTPRAQLACYGSAGTGYAEADLNTFFNSNSTVTPLHYGLKVALDGSQSSGVNPLGAFRFFVKALFECKEPK